MKQNISTSVLAIALAGANVSCADNARSASNAARAKPAKDVRSAGGYRIVGTPVAFVKLGRTPQGEPFVDGSVALRLNRALPKRDLLIAATILLNGGTGASPPVGFGNRNRHCYTQSTDSAGDPPPKTGDRGRLTVRIEGVPRQLSVAIRFRAEREGARLYEKLNCGEGPIDNPD